MLITVVTRLIWAQVELIETSMRTQERSGLLDCYDGDRGRYRAASADLQPCWMGCGRGLDCYVLFRQ